MLELILPDETYQQQYHAMLAAWQAAAEEPAPWVLQLNYADFGAMVRLLSGYAQGMGVPQGFVPSTTFWAYDAATDAIIGAVNIRHFLNDGLLRWHGHIGYGVRPDMRGKGHATRMLLLAKEECRRLGIKRALLCCYQDNFASARVIEKNGGVLENEVSFPENGRIIKRYWMEI